MDKFESTSQKLEKITNLSVDEVSERYKGVVESNKEKALKNLDKMNYGRLNTDPPSFKNVPTYLLGDKILNVLSKINRNFSNLENKHLNDLPKEDALLYIAYYQDIMDIKIDGTLGKQTFGKVKESFDHDIAIALKKAKEQKKARDEAGVMIASVADSVGDMIKADPGSKNLNAALDNAVTRGDEKETTLKTGLDEDEGGKIVTSIEPDNISAKTQKGPKKRMISSKNLSKTISILRRKGKVRVEIGLMNKLKDRLELYSNKSETEAAKNLAKKDLASVESLISYIEQNREKMEANQSEMDKYLDMKDKAMASIASLPKKN